MSLSLPIGDRLPKRGNRFTRAAGALTLRLFGWRLEGAFPNLEKLVAIGAPHTSAWDFPIAMLAILALGLEATWLGADWIFRYPLIRSLGGQPVDRSRSQGMVEAYLQKFESSDRFILGILPEGSRKKVVPWKAGFYHIAVGAGVPILMIAMDRRNRTLTFGPTLDPTGDYDADFAKIRKVYARFLDEYPDQFGM